MEWNGMEWNGMEWNGIVYYVYYENKNTIVMIELAPPSSFSGFPRVFRGVSP